MLVTPHYLRLWKFCAKYAGGFSIIVTTDVNIKHMLLQLLPRNWKHHACIGMPEQRLVEALVCTLNCTLNLFAKPSRRIVSSWSESLINDRFNNFFCATNIWLPISRAGIISKFMEKQRCIHDSDFSLYKNKKVLLREGLSFFFLK